MRTNGKKPKGRKPNKSKGKGVFIALLLLAVFCLIGFLGYKTLRVAHIGIEGNEDIPSEEIVKLSNVQMDQHMLSLDLKAISLAVSKQPFLEVLGVKRKFPDTLVISLHERKRDAALQAQNTKRYYVSLAYRIGF